MIIGLIFIQSLFTPDSVAQTTSFTFRRLTNTEGLSDGVVHAFIQDKYGFLWIGTSYGLNRFDGMSIKTWFYGKDDSTSLDNNFIQSLYCDSKDNLWVGTLSGLCRYDYTTNRFTRYSSPPSLVIYAIREDRKGMIWLATSRGLWTLNEKEKKIRQFTLNDNADFKKKFQVLIRQIVESPGGNWLMATTGGIKIFNPLTYSYSEIVNDPLNKSSISSNNVVAIALDKQGYLWAASSIPGAILNKINLKDSSVTFYDHFMDPEKKWTANHLQALLSDSKGRLWVTSAYSGLSLYDPKGDTFYDYRNDPLIPTSLLSNQNTSIYQGRDGIIWLGTPGYGLSYFNPEKNFFHTVYPFFEKNEFTTDTWCRAACEDDQGNYWLGTGKGLARYNSNWQMISSYINEEGKKPVIQFSSIRSLMKDHMGDVWIGTAQGLNRYHTATGVMEFYNDKQGIPLGFFWMMTEDNNGVLWMGSAGGLFRYHRNENRFDDLREDSVLSKYAYKNIQAIYTDNHNRIWIGVLDIGLVMYDATNKTQKLLTIKDSLISDTRFSSFTEDKEGVIWIGSEEGLTAYNPLTGKSKFFNSADGLPSNRTNNLMVDSLDRLWIGTSNGLCMLNKDRNTFKRFDVNDGILTNHFNEQSAYRTKSGLFIYPTYKGFLIFHPEDYHENITNTPVYITSFKISNKEIAANSQDLSNVHLRYNENFFSIELAGLDYMNPYQCVYAYQLYPFNKDWIYTTKREINYTNVPAGDYTFRYKVITGASEKNGEEKSIHISIGEIYYKTWWFRSHIVLIILGAIMLFYRYRIRQREKILVLQNKAQLLEKEKTSVMYENLKQHLNPHFLFNSLASLSSLIRLDQHMAGDFLDKMSKVYRYILKNRDNETVPLSEELKFVDLYIQLQKTRFAEGLQVNMNINEEYLHRKIAPVTLQNLVENAIKHNISDVDTPLIIDLFIENDYLVVQNNLQKKNFVETSNKQGLINMISLYKYLGRRPMLVTEDTKHFTVKIPLI